MARPMAAEKRVKVQITLPKSVDEKLADYAKRVGLPKSTMGSVLIGQALAAADAKGQVNVNA